MHSARRATHLAAAVGFKGLGFALQDLNTMGARAAAATTLCSLCQAGTYWTGTGMGECLCICASLMGLGQVRVGTDEGRRHFGEVRTVGPVRLAIESNL